MGITGRPPTPTAIKKAEGNPGKRKLNAAELREPTIAPACPKWLSAEAKKKWRQLAKILTRRKLLREEDGMLLASICQAYADMVDARKALESMPAATRMLVKSGNTFVVNPLFYLVKHNVELLYKLGSRFGFSPADRARLDFEDDDAGSASPEKKGLEGLMQGNVEHDEHDPLIQ